MLTIHKYEYTSLPIEMPKNAQILTVQMQRGCIYIWALVDTEKPKELRRFFAYVTGGEIDEKDMKFLTYIATVQDGSYVLHFFEVKE